MSHYFESSRWERSKIENVGDAGLHDLCPLTWHTSLTQIPFLISTSSFTSIQALGLSWHLKRQSLFCVKDKTKIWFTERKTRKILRKILLCYFGKFHLFAAEYKDNTCQPWMNTMVVNLIDWWSQTKTNLSLLAQTSLPVGLDTIRRKIMPILRFGRSDFWADDDDDDDDGEE